MQNNNKDKNVSQQMPSERKDLKDGAKTSTTTTRPEIDLPLKGGRADTDLASKTQPKRDDRAVSDKKPVR